MYIQIITLKGSNKSSRVMIEEYSNNIYVIQIDTKRQEDKFYNGFQYLFEDKDIKEFKKFKSAKDALQYIIEENFKGDIKDIDNEISCLLSEEEIKSISNLEKINNR